MSDVDPDIEELALAELGAHRGDFERLRQDPAALLELLRVEEEFRDALVRADVLPYLRQWFDQDGPGWEVDSERSGVLGGSSTGTSWSFHGVHQRDQFKGLPPTGRRVVVRGFTIMSPGEKHIDIRRHVDWAGLYGQLGLTVNWRVPLDAPDLDP